MYYSMQPDGSLTGELYDCNWQIISTWGSSSDLVEINYEYDQENSIMKRVKDLYNLGYHYYSDDYVYFSNEDESSYGREYSDGTGKAQFDDQDTTGYFTQVYWTCNGASGNSTVEQYDQGSWTYILVDFEEWDYG